MRKPSLILTRTFSHKGRQYVIPPPIPPRAHFTELRRNRICVQGEFSYDGRRAQVAWSRKGNVLSERYFDDSGRTHGMELSRFENGDIEWQVPWLRGQMHGLARQFDTSGKVLSRSRFVSGTGLDLWVDGGAVSELRQMRESTPHGIERWGHPLFPYDEGHYLQGKRAGVFRRWTGSQLEDGYPKYFVEDFEIDRAHYARACKRNSELPLDRRSDDARERRTLKELNSIWLRREIRITLSRDHAMVVRQCGEST